MIQDGFEETSLNGLKIKRWMDAGRIYDRGAHMLRSHWEWRVEAAIFNDPAEGALFPLRECASGEGQSMAAATRHSQSHGIHSGKRAFGQD